MKSGEKKGAENPGLSHSGQSYVELRDIVALHMRGSLGLSQVVAWLVRNRARTADLGAEPRMKSLLGYVLSASLSFGGPRDIEVHEVALDVCCRKEFVPGIIGKYITLILAKSQYIKDIFLLVQKVLGTLARIDEVPELEERLFLCLSQTLSDSGSDCSPTGLLKYLALRASPQMTGVFMRLYLKSKGDVDEQMSSALESYMASIRDIDVFEILRSHRTEINTAARYSISAVNWLVERAASILIQDRGPEKSGPRNAVIEWLREVRNISSLQTNPEHSDSVSTALSAGPRVDTPRGISLLVQSPNHLLVENALRLSLPVMLDVIRVSPDMELVPGSQLGELLMIRVLEDTCDKSVLESPSLRSVLDIPKELSVKYDHYMGLAFRKGTSTALSINILGALAEYVCPVRLNDIPLRIARAIKEIEIGERRGRNFPVRSLVLRTDTAIRAPCTVLRKVLQRGEVCKKVLRSVFDALVFLLSQHEPVVDSAASVLQVVLTRYAEEDGKEPKEKRERDNVYVLCSRIYEEVDMDLFSHSHRAALLELLVTMIQCTDTFLAARLNDTALEHVLTYYSRHRPLVRNREAAALLSFLRHLSLIGIRKDLAQNTLAVVSGMYDMGMEEAVHTLSMLHRQHPRLLPDAIEGLPPRNPGIPTRTAYSAHALACFAHILAELSGSREGSSSF